MPLVILAHPHLEKSFANRPIIHALKTSKLKDLEIRDLSFLYPDFNINIKAEQDALIRHKTIIFQYPFFWYNMPAILKHWFDVVFEYQFAYGSNGDQLKGKSFLPSFTVGGPASEYHALGEHHFRIEEFCKHLEQTAYYAQMKYQEPLYFHAASLNAGYTIAEIEARAIDHACRLITRIETLERK